MLEQRATWIREIRFDRIETIAEMNAETLRRMLGGFDPEPFDTDYINLDGYLPLRIYPGPESC